MIYEAITENSDVLNLPNFFASLTSTEFTIINMINFILSCYWKLQKKKN